MAKTKGAVKMLLDLQRVLNKQELEIIGKVSDEKNN
jgi:hypothetical protein